jgi:hypothetical protein
MNGRLEFVRPTVASGGFNHLGELLDAKQVGTLLQAEFGAAAPSPQRLQSQRRLFCVICAGEELYPAFQWHQGQLIPGLKAVLNTLTPYRSAWRILAWLSAENRHLDGRRPADLLASADAAVAAVARTELLERSIKLE